MSTDRHGLFTQLEPPPGGAERFERRLHKAAASPSPAPRWRTFALAGAACAAVALIVAVVLRRDSDRPVMPPLVADLQPTPEIYNSPAFDRLLGRPAQFTELTVSRNEQSASVVELETASAKVRIYQIE
jgi:hypothetical protein